MDTQKTLALLTLLLVKHFVVDWCLQTDDEVKHKGTYFHPTGIMHSVKHALGTVLVTVPFLSGLGFALGVVDGIIHYHIDWAKQNVTRRLGVSPQNKAFWVLIGLDQLLHQLTYLSLVLYSLWAENGQIP